MHNNPHESAHKLSRSLHHQLSHFVASVGFTFGILMVGLFGTWVVRNVLTETRQAHLTGRVAGAFVERRIPTHVVLTAAPTVSFAIEEFAVFPKSTITR